MGKNSEKRLDDLDVEVIRIPFERELAQALGRNPEFRALIAQLPKADPKKARRDLQAFTLPLSDAMAPDVYAAVREAMRRLAVDKLVEVYQTAGQGSADLNASVNLTDDTTIRIVIRGREFNHFDSVGKIDVMGHEVGHYLAHGPGWDFVDVSYAAYLVAAQGGPERLERQARGLSVAQELTADRFALLASRDLDVHLRAHMIGASGIPMRELTWDPRGYLEQARKLMDETLTKGETAKGFTHPEHSLRAYAAWLFSETEVYADLVGLEKAPTRTLSQVNTALRRLLNPEINWYGNPSQQGGFAAPGGAPGGPGVRRRAPRQTRPIAAPHRHGVFSGKVGQPVVKDGPPSKDDELLEGVTGAVSRASKALRPGISKLKAATTDGVSRVLGRKMPTSSRSSSSSSSYDDVPDPLDEDEQDLLDRFAALEKKMQGDE